MKKQIILTLVLFFHFGANAQVSKTVNVSTAGTLSTVLSTTEKTTLTNLILTGNVDARDFKCLRDEMPALAVLDMSGVNITAYSGNEGTYPYNSSYSVNTFPAYAFYNSSRGTGKTSLKSVKLPASATSIGNYAFSGCSGLAGDLKIPEGVRSIGSYAYHNCKGLDGSITLPTTLNSIGSLAFYNCSGLSGNLIIPESVTSIGNSAFYNCSSLSGDLIIPNAVNSIGSYTFGNCSGFTGNLTISNSVSSIGSSAFSGCNGLTGRLTLPDKLISIENNAFYQCSGLTGYLSIPSTVVSIGDNAFYYCTQLTGNLNIPKGVTRIGNYAFAGCSGISGSLIIPDAVTTIGSYAFYYCTKINGSTLMPANVTSIGESAFRGCYDMTEFVVSANNQNYSSYQGVLFNKNQTELIQCPSGKQGSFVIPSQVIVIHDNAFALCIRLTGSLNIPASVVSIGNTAFTTCVGISRIDVDLANQNYSSSDGVLFNKDRTTLIQCPGGKSGVCYIPNTVKIIGNAAFQNCTKLTAINVPNSVTTIQNDAFYNCAKLTSITIPGTVTTIGTYAFYRCLVLATIHCQGNIPPTLSSNCFMSTPTITDVFVPTDDAVAAYKGNTDWYGWFPGNIIKKTVSSGTAKLLDTQVKVYVAKSEIIVEGTSLNETVSIYNTSGVMLQRSQSKGDRLIFTVERKGIYIVKTANRIIKVVVA